MRSHPCSHFRPFESNAFDLARAGCPNGQPTPLASLLDWHRSSRGPTSASSSPREKCWSDESGIQGQKSVHEKACLWPAPGSELARTRISES